MPLTDPFPKKARIRSLWLNVTGGPADLHKRRKQGAKTDATAGLPGYLQQNPNVSKQPCLRRVGAICRVCRIQRSSFPLLARYPQSLHQSLFCQLLPLAKSPNLILIHCNLQLTLGPFCFLGPHLTPFSSGQDFRTHF